MNTDFTPQAETIRNQYAIHYLFTLLESEINGGSTWWALVNEEILQSSLVSLGNAINRLAKKINNHEDAVLLVNTHLRVMTKAVNSPDLLTAIAFLEKTFVEQVVPVCDLTFDFINKDGTLTLDIFERVLFFIFFYQDEIINQVVTGFGQ